MQCQITLIGLVSTTSMDTYVTPTNNIDYSCHIKATELILPIIWGLYVSHYIMPLVVHSLRGRHTHTHTDIRGQKQFLKKPGMHWPVTSIPWINNDCTQSSICSAGFQILEYQLVLKVLKHFIATYSISVTSC